MKQIIKALKFLILLCLLLFKSSGMNAEQVDSNYISTLTSKFSKVTLEDVAQNPHGYSVDSVINKLREMDAEYTASHSKVLIRLNDEYTINKYLNLFIESDGADVRVLRTLANSGAPWVIPDMLELFNEDLIQAQTHTNSGQYQYYGLSGSAILVTRGIILKAPEFSDEIREWNEGIKFRGAENLNEAHDQYLKWWEINKAAFEAEDYAKVVPLENITVADAPPTSPVQGVAEIIEEATAPEVANEESAEVVLAEPLKEDVEQSSNWVLWLIGAVVIVGGIGLAVRRKS